MAKRVELLAPCGSYESFLAAVNAGADAVYLGGRQFGARAYAENFSEKELVTVIKKAHLFGVKVYLTVNTLVKEREFSEIYDYMLPLYEAGLDGAIIQDMGVFCFLKQNFPELALHASTQMTITGAYGAAYLKEMGCERIVPARELSLAEIREIKRKVSIEIEAFIHGAMCYCYSGQCLMSSMIGGRSGNRGRCAGPCRLPYKVAGKEGYYLSLKDMNTLELLPKLIEAGIDSFKIEGRMKKPEYVAGVVSVYRKYIDAYYDRADNIAYGIRNVNHEKADKSACKDFRMEKKDKKLLSALYIRSETGNGYYEKRNGADMLTLHKPGYNEADQTLLEELREKYVHELPETGIRIFAECSAGRPLYGEVRFIDRISDREVCLSVSGETVTRADKRAVSEAEIRGQLVKTGGTPFAVQECAVETEGNAFVPMSRVKELRRALLQKIYEYYGARDSEKVCRTKRCEKNTDGRGSKEAGERERYTLTIFVQTKEQCKAVFSAMEREEAAELPIKSETGVRAEERAGGVKEYLIADADLITEDREIQEMLSSGKIHWGIKCPVILRNSDEKFLGKLQALIEVKKPEIIYCATIDALGWVKSISYTGKIAGEASLYAWNQEAVSHWCEELERVSIPLELESREIRELCVACTEIDYDSQLKGGPQMPEKEEVSKTANSLCARLEAPVYGRAPFMVTANCIKLSAGKCDKNRGHYTELTDRLGNTFPVYTNCSHCYNIIYNCLPTSYQDGLWMLLQDKIRAFRIEFTTETGVQSEEIRQTFRQILASELLERDDKAAGMNRIKGTGGKAVKRNDRKVGKKKAPAQKRAAGMETTQGRFCRSVE